MDTKSELPLGLGMALAQNVSAMERFCSMSEQEKRAVIDHTRAIKSKQEMHNYVESLGSFEG